MSRKVSIVGAGQGGLMLGIGLVDAGYEVTILSDRTADEIRTGTVPSSAGLSPDAQRAEEELGLNYWDDEVETLQGVYLDVVMPDGNVATTLKGPWGYEGGDWRCVDLRLKYWRWMHEFERRGGKLVVKEATVADIEECAERSDLTVIAAGKGEISRLFERDEERSTWSEPPRNLSMIITKNHPGWVDKAGFRPLHYIIFVGAGEIFSGTFLNATEERTVFHIFEAVPGGPIDRFSDVSSAEEQLRVSKEIFRDLAPWEWERVKDMQLADPGGGFRGRFIPAVRKPVVRLPSGAIATGIGDTLCLKDPVGGQGANSAAKGAQHLLARVLERGGEPLDADWMSDVWNSFWERYEQYADRFNNQLLRPEEFQIGLIFAASQNPELARKLFYGFSHPPSASPWFFDEQEAGRLVSAGPAA